MTDPVMSVLYSAMNGLMTRQDAITANLANVSTPGYKAKTVDFEAALRQAVSDGTGSPADVASVSVSNAPVNQIGNNVSIDSETTTAADTTLRYQAVVGSMNAKFQLLRTAIGG